MSEKHFKSLKLIEPLLRALEEKGYSTPTPIQEQTIPPLLEGKDMMGIAQTGTGKTAAFLLPILQHLSKDDIRTPGRAPAVLILAPTRELAAQIGASCKVYGKFLNIEHTVIFGGVKQGSQVKALKSGIDILVATPGRLLDLIQQGYISLEYIEIFVLDEADRMLDMGFIHDVKKIMNLIPKNTQTLCFSATMSKEVETLTRGLLNDPVHVAVTPQATTVELIEQSVLFVDQVDKEEVLIDLLKQEHLKRVLIFIRTKSRANKLCKKLTLQGIKVDAIHGNKSQKQRTQALSNFKKGRSRVLVATDIAARGIDVEEISHVINFDLPNEPENYVHRIGRTARAGAKGRAYSFCAAEERGYLSDIEKLIKQNIEIIKHKKHSNKAQNSRGPFSRSAHKQRNRKGGFRTNRSRKSKGQGGFRNKISRPRRQ
ncbi:DEAD/DEAH box helicase [archaeon]|nr:DEAD/DEAH box helicase [archaeon]MBT4021766.1 DEAD/DEAH box helicase [archaeon]MBT4271819.1 DEAD/DEAH box helicase [archaeon]MBT4460486.1 DEAD/DEAH box helicase [archaeon]MBT4858506.1 DEAD/DEAH box helicase [archaeon]